MINKENIRKRILRQLREDYQNAIKSAADAHDAATNEESKAENKYDTRGLEASYLAEGQSRRVAELEQAVAIYEKLELAGFSDESPIRLTALVTLEDMQGECKRLFIGPISGGMKVVLDEVEYLVVTPKAPLGGTLIGKFVGDEVTIGTSGSTTHYDIVAVY